MIEAFTPGVEGGGGSEVAIQWYNVGGRLARLEFLARTNISNEELSGVKIV